MLNQIFVLFLCLDVQKKSAYSQHFIIELNYVKFPFKINIQD